MTTAALDSLGTAPPRHFVQFYESDRVVVDAVADFLAPALRAGDPGIIIATREHREALAEVLTRRGIDSGAAQAAGRFIPLDAAETLSLFMQDGSPDPTLFKSVVGGLVAKSMEGGRTLRAYGEMVALLTAAGNGAAALRLEELWNELQDTYPFSLFCAYPMTVLDGEALGPLHHQVCGTHSMVIPTESYTAIEDDDQRLRSIAVLQQKARSLEAQIELRKEAERRLEAALQAERAARETAEAAVRTREEFLAVASHELRTPLASLMGEAQLALRRLARGSVEPERMDQSLRVINGQAGKLTRLTTQLLDISRLDAGKLAIEREAVDLAALVDHVVSDARARADGRPIHLSVPDTLHAVVDPLRLEQVLVNLLDNATKYSPEGTPIEVTLTTSGPETVELSVRDYGLGIPGEKRAHIFERFYQAHLDGNRSGLGIGLYVSREIVTLHGGEIWVESPAGGGTRFILTIPTS